MRGCTYKRSLSKSWITCGLLSAGKVIEDAQCRVHGVMPTAFPGPMVTVIRIRVGVADRLLFSSLSICRTMAPAYAFIS